MKIYLLECPRNYDQYARFSHVGTWTKGGICKSCGQGRSRLTEPLAIEWEIDSDIIGDFSCCGYVMAVVGKVKKYLLNKRFECQFGKVVVSPPTKNTRKKRVPYPYVGPYLNWVIPTDYIELNEKESGVGLQIDCSDCDQKRYAFKREGIVIERDVWEGRKIFRIKQFYKSSATFITEEAIKMLLDKDFSNIGYSVAGYIR